MNKFLNWNVFSWKEIIDALKDEKNWFHNIMTLYFSDYQSYFDEVEKEEDIVLCFSEDCIEISNGDYFLVNFKEDYGYSIKELSEIKKTINDYMGKEIFENE